MKNYSLYTKRILVVVILLLFVSAWLGLLLTNQIHSAHATTSMMGTDDLQSNLRPQVITTQMAGALTSQIPLFDPIFYFVNMPVIIK